MIGAPRSPSPVRLNRRLSRWPDRAIKAAVTGDAADVIWSVNGTASGNTAVSTINPSGNFTATDVTTNAPATVTAASKSDPSKMAFASVTIIAPGLVAPAANVQVARYDAVAVECWIPAAPLAVSSFVKAALLLQLNQSAKTATIK